MDDASGRWKVRGLSDGWEGEVYVALRAAGLSEGVFGGGAILDTFLVLVCYSVEKLLRIAVYSSKYSRRDVNEEEMLLKTLLCQQSQVSVCLRLPRRTTSTTTARATTRYSATIETEISEHSYLQRTLVYRHNWNWHVYTGYDARSLCVSWECDII